MLCALRHRNYICIKIQLIHLDVNTSASASKRKK